ncbi:hypothetical protein MKEN_00057300 [Mycena kentingensis (nom. inval.)]|nr:hypothetical protein MKEN_00057300 [Mycena kentingensis (nom. inval.)]
MATENIVHGTNGQLVLFLFLNIWPSHIGLPVLLATILFNKRVNRHPTFISLCAGFILIGVASCLLLYAGATTGPEPTKELCLLQASILYVRLSALVASLLALMLVLQMFLVVRASSRKQEAQGPQTLRLWAMLGTPYVALLLTIVVSVVVGVNHPEKVSRSRRFFYCSIEENWLSGTIAAVGAAFLLATVVFEIWTLVIIYKNYKLKGALDLNLPLRVMAFGLYVVIAISLSLLSVSSPSSPIPDLVIASAATVIILIFGTQRDILRALCFWRKDPALKFNALGSSPRVGGVNNSKV